MPSPTDDTVPTSATSIAAVVALELLLEDGGDLVGLDVHLNIPRESVSRKAGCSCVRNCPSNATLPTTWRPRRRSARGRAETWGELDGSPCARRAPTGAAPLAASSERRRRR